MAIPTPHIQITDPSKLAKTVLMPGDPRRAKYIADNFLTDVELVNEVRGMLGFTGYYNGHKVTVMGSGMGMPSIGIYSYELYNFYGVERIIRIGSAGSYQGHINVGDVVIADAAYSESSFAMVQNGNPDKVIDSTKELNDLIIATANSLELKEGTKVHHGVIHSSDVFYAKDGTAWKKLVNDYNVLCVEMESFALFNTAKWLNKQAACIITISDSFVSHQEMTSKEREIALNDMIKIALEVSTK